MDHISDSELVTDCGLTHVGKMHGRIDLFTNENLTDSDEMSALVAYKGISDVDAGYILSPYVLVMGSGAVDDGLTTMTRFGDTVDDKSALYFRKLTFKI